MATIVLTIAGEEETSIKDLYYVLLKANVSDIRQVKKLIKNHKVYVNDICITEFKYQVSRYDKIKVNNETVEYPFIYYMMNKPKGYVCASSDMDHQTVVSLLNKKVNCIGRLDIDTTGLLLLSNDTNHLKRLLYPENHHQKTYYVTLDLPLKDELVPLFKAGISIYQYTCLPAKLEIIDDYHCYLTIEEGKYHQIKKMFHSLGYRVTDLHRISFGPLKLDENLHPGEYRELTDEEINALEECIRV